MSHRPIYYDTETTGLKTQKDRIIELAAYDPQRGCSFEQLIHPGCAIPPEATAIHHITDEMVMHAPPFEAAARAFMEFCSGDVILVAHNNDAFDLPFLKSEFERNNISFPNWMSFDSLRWAKRYRPDLPRHHLQGLREVYGIPANRAHRALDDVIVLAQVMEYMLDDLHISLAHALLYQPRKIYHMPFGKYQGQPLKSVPKSYVTWLASSGVFEKEENQLLKKAFIELGLIA